MSSGITVKEFIVDPVYLPYSNTFLGNWRLLKFQEEVYHRLGKEKDIVLVAPTGSGKTLTLLLATVNDYNGAVGVYPNNTLLLDQKKSIDKILREALNAELVETMETVGDGEASEIMRIYRIPSKSCDRGIFEDYEYVVLTCISGKSVKRQIKGVDETPRYKRDILMDAINRIQALGKHVYKITLTTPDTLLLIMMGMYRDFEDVGKTVHNTLYAIQAGLDPEDIVRESRVAVRTTVLSKIRQIREILFDKPLFIDEFHLYGSYELDALIPLLWINRNVLGSETPIILSSATPSDDVIGEIENIIGIKFDTVRAETSRSGRLIRGKTTVRLLLIDKNSRSELRRLRGIGAWIYLGDLIPAMVSSTEILKHLKNVVKSNQHAIIVLDKVYQVAETAVALASLGLPVSCEATVKPSVCSENANIIVGSEAITQGINLADAVFGLLTGYSAQTVIQRAGRIGRGTESTVYMVALYRRNIDDELDSIARTGRISHTDFIELIERIYPSYDPKKIDPTSQYTDLHLTRRTLLKIIGVMHIERTTGVKPLIEGIKDVKHLIDQNKMMRVMGTPDTVAKLMMFRASGFTVNYVIKDDNRKGEADIGVILRNFRVEDVFTAESQVHLVISLEKSRQYLALRTPPHMPTPNISRLSRTIMPLRSLVKLGYRLYIEEQDGDSIEIPVTKNMKEQTIALFHVPEKIREYIVYTVRGIQVYTHGEPLVAVFL